MAMSTPNNGRYAASLPLANTALCGGDIHDRVAAALQVEVNLTPKPGLVDRANSGSHRDMDVSTFEASIAALTPWFGRFTAAGAAHHALPLTRLLAAVRPVGLGAEQAMLAATGGVNTHKGGIFAFGSGMQCRGLAERAGRTADTAGVVRRRGSHDRRSGDAGTGDVTGDGGDGRGALVSTPWLDRGARRGGERVCDGAHARAAGIPGGVMPRRDGRGGAVAGAGGADGA